MLDTKTTFKNSVHTSMLLLHIIIYPNDQQLRTSDEFYQTDIKSHDSHVREMAMKEAEPGEKSNDLRETMRLCRHILRMQVNVSVQ